MAILIRHKFHDRLSTFSDDVKISCLIIGTFNPGHPAEEQLNETEKKQFEAIKQSKKYQKSSLINNFYDRSNNRFWKIMDIINSPAFYELNNNYKRKNPDGLKFYLRDVKMDRDKTFDRQQKFCKYNEIFITDLVKSIQPISFNNIYEQFPDSVIETSQAEWNTSAIEAMIEKYSIKNVLVNFDFDGRQTPNINKQIKRIKERFPETNVVRIMSPSGAAGNSYTDLLADWERFIEIKSEVPAT